MKDFENKSLDKVVGSISDVASVISSAQSDMTNTIEIITSQVPRDLCADMEKIKLWVLENYSPRKCSWTAMRSMGNYSDCFADGFDSGTAWAAYEIGTMLGLELEEPEEPPEDEY